MLKDYTPWPESMSGRYHQSDRRLSATLVPAFETYSILDHQIKISLPRTFRSQPLTNKAVCHKDIWGSGSIDLRFLDLGTKWR
jgi:hypothetical protein